MLLLTSLLAAVLPAHAALGDSYDTLDRTDGVIATGGDVNGDGYADVALLKNGRAYLYFGSVTGIGTTYGQVRTTGLTDVNAAAMIWDVDGDGDDELVLGASADNAGLGRIAICRGTAAGVDRCQRVADGTSTAPGAGSELAAAGDVNGDGRGDFVVSNAAGAVSVYTGNGTAVPSRFYTARGLVHLVTGRALAGGGDVNGDGYSDFFVGGLVSSEYEQGGLYVYRGAASSAGVRSQYVYYPHGYGPYYCGYGISMGYSVQSVGDPNGNGYDDVIAGAPWDLSSCTYGINYLWYGNSRGVGSGTYTEFDGSDWTYDSYDFARSTAGAADYNGDGMDDLAFGGSVVQVWYGTTTPWATGDSPQEYPDVYIHGYNPYGIVNDVYAAGDVNADGFDDLLVHRQTGDATWAFELYYGG